MNRERTRPRWVPPPIWIYVVMLGIVASGLTWATADWSPVLDGPHVPWWLLAVSFFVAERLVLHLRLRKDAHSFSMSEIPLVIALFLVEPIAAISAQVVANGLVLWLHRRQQPVKLFFNIAQFAIQTSVAFIVFRAVLGAAPDAIGPIGWLAAAAGAIGALAAADVLINGAIQLSGGKLSRTEVFTVFLLGTLGTLMNASLALVFVTLLVVRPESALLGLAPPLVLFIAYRAYLKQREEGARLEALYGATKALHASPQIEAALAVAAQTARRMVDADYAEVFLFPTDESSPAFRTTSGPGDHVSRMRPAGPDATESMHRLLVASDGNLISTPIEHETPGGEIQVNDGVVVPLDLSGQTVGLMFVANRLGDVSSFDHEDARLLETVAAQVAISLENGRLEHSLSELSILKEQLEELIKSKDELVASVSHELRTPLTAVVGLAQELQANRSDFSVEESTELMGLIADQSGELADIVDDLLVAARADAGSLVLNREELNITHEVEDLITRFGDGTSIGEVEIRCDAEAVSAYADPVRIRQIIRNLLSNADRYGGEKAWIEIATTGTSVTIAMADDGPGVGDASIEAIFEPYQRAEAGTHHPLSVGLGLAVSRKLARLMGGDLEYHRADGITRFILELPATAAASAA